MSKSPENCRFREHKWDIYRVQRGTSGAPENWLVGWKCSICYASIDWRDLDALEFEDLLKENPPNLTTAMEVDAQRDQKSGHQHMADRTRSYIARAGKW